MRILRKRQIWDGILIIAIYIYLDPYLNIGSISASSSIYDSFITVEYTRLTIAILLIDLEKPPDILKVWKAKE